MSPFCQIPRNRCPRSTVEGKNGNGSPEPQFRVPDANTCLNELIKSRSWHTIMKP
uniref:Uncharacterized protein n=1 Tax=Anguilla anguilla TaxID=7936 RepID=A0A0E9PSZ5_ANGAN